MNRIDLKFNSLKEEKRKAMITFITAGDPNLETTEELVISMEKYGADIVELGIPYSDPLADGLVIQASSSRALANGARISRIMNSVKKIREKSNIPLIYLVYFNSIFRYGIEKFMKESSEVGIDGLIIPDLPIEERKEIISIGGKYNIYLVPLVAPTSKDRIKKITENAKGFVYCISTSGVTGVRNDINTNMKEYMDSISQYTNLPKAIGFGISGPEMAEKFKPYCEGIIIGSAIVKKISERKSREETIESIGKFISDIKSIL